MAFITSSNSQITAAHIPGIYNEEADKESRKQEMRTKWKLNTKDFEYVIEQLSFAPSIDLFA